MRIATRRTLQVIHFGVSIAANIVTILIPLLGFILGITHLPQGYGLLSKPGPVLTLMYVAMWLGWFWMGCSALKLVRRRSGNKPNEASFEVLMYVVTLPLAVSWILTWGELIGWPNAGPGTTSADSDAGFALILFGGAALFAGGGVVAYVALAIDKLFNPGDYPD